MELSTPLTQTVSTYLGHPLPSLLLDGFPPLVLGQGVNGVCVLPEVSLKSHQEVGSAGTVVGHLGDPLLPHVLQGGRYHHAVTDQVLLSVLLLNTSQNSPIYDECQTQSA